MMTTNSHYGIDYSGPMGTCNRDQTTGIRYGLISTHELEGWIYDECETVYYFGCPYCGHEFSKRTREGNSDKVRCPQCRKISNRDDCWGDEPIETFYAGEDLSFFIDDSGDLWVTKSRYVTFAMFCSPCVPGGCSLGSPVDTDGPIAYCLPKEYFPEETPPYKIYTLGNPIHGEGGSLIPICDDSGDCIRTIRIAPKRSRE